MRVPQTSVNSYRVQKTLASLLMRCGTRTIIWTACLSGLQKSASKGAYDTEGLHMMIAETEARMRDCPILMFSSYSNVRNIAADEEREENHGEVGFLSFLL